MLICGLVIILSLWKRWFLYILIVVFSAVNTSLHTPMKLDHRGRTLSYSGTVVSEDPREHYVKLLINIDKAVFTHGELKYGIPVEFYAYKDKTYLGKRLLLTGKIRSPKYASQPNILSGRIVRTDLDNNLLGGILYSIRNYIGGLLKEVLSDEHYDLAMGLVLGGSGRLKKDLKEVFIRTGVLHILAVSGLHVGFVCMFVYSFLLFIPIVPKVKFLIVMLILLLYAGLTGFRPSVCRATIMAFLFGLALVFQRNVDGIHITNIAAIIFLIINPLLIFNVGAQLSFAAVYGIFFLYPKIEDRLIKKVKKRLYKFVLAPMAVSFSAQIFILPLLIYYFKRLPTLAVFSNLLIVPIASIIVMLLFLCLITGGFSFLLAQAIASCVSVFILVLIAISKLFASIFFSTVSLVMPSAALVLSYFIYVKRLRKIVILSIITLSVFFSISALADCVVIKTASGGTLITIPGGENIYVTRKRSHAQNIALLTHQQICEVDYLIAAQKYFPVKREFFDLPDQLHTKRITLGNVIIDIAKDVILTFRGKKIAMGEYDCRDSGKTDNILYIISDGKDVQVFSTALHGSIIDQIVVDLKLLYARLKFLF